MLTKTNYLNSNTLLTNDDSAALQALFERASVARNAWAKNKQ